MKKGSNSNTISSSTTSSSSKYQHSILYQSHYIQLCRNVSLHDTIIKLVASKLALVIRCDYMIYIQQQLGGKEHQYHDPSYHTNSLEQQHNDDHDNDMIDTTNTNHTILPGQKFRQLVEQKIIQLQEPTKAPVLKALPK